MNDYFNFRGGNVEQPAGFNDFEALVHQRGGIDSDTASHFPGGMIERLLDSDGVKIGFGRVQERTAGGGEPDGGDLVHASAAQALVDGIVLGIDREERLALLAGFGGDEFAGGNETFFVGEADGLAGFHSFVSGFKSGDANDGADDEIHFGVGGDGNGAG
jgi:hypothetical protein